MTRLTNLSSWALIDAPFSSAKEDPAHYGVTGLTRWEDVVSKLRSNRVEVLKPDASALEGFAQADVVIIAGHSYAHSSVGVALGSRRANALHPSAFPAQLKCRLLWLDTCNGHLWLDHGLRSRVRPGTVIVGTDSDAWDAYSVGGGALVELGYEWMGPDGPPAQADLPARIETLLRNAHRSDMPQNLRVSVA